MRAKLHNSYILLSRLVLSVGLGMFLSACDLSELVRVSKTATSDTAIADDPQLSPSPTPVPSGPSPNYHKVSVGAYRQCSVNSSGVAGCAGSNYDASNGIYGILGIGLATSATRTNYQALDDADTYLSVGAGEFLTCGITAAKRVKCWGYLVGDGSTSSRYSPTSILDTTSEFVDLAVGSYHACAIASDGVMKCWGDGWDGKLGNGSTAVGSSPVTADSGTAYKRVAAGRNHTCGITMSGILKCWGTNSAGQLGIGSTATPQLTPQVVDTGVSYSEIAAGENHTCGITTAGVLKCWGANGSGQVGDGTTTARSAPTVIESGTAYSKVAVASSGYHTCGITTAGVVKCWGANGSSRLGDGTTTSRSTPTPVSLTTPQLFREVATGGAQSCAISTGGQLYCWGANTWGQLAIGNTTTQTSPASVGTGY